MLLNKKIFTLLVLSLFSFVYATQWTINITNNKKVKIFTSLICKDIKNNVLEVLPNSVGTCYAVTQKDVSNPYWPSSHYPISIESDSVNIGSVMIDDINNNTIPFDITSWDPIFSVNNNFAVGYHIVHYMDQHQIQLKSFTLENNQPVVDVIINDPQF